MGALITAEHYLAKVQTGEYRMAELEEKLILANAEFEPWMIEKVVDFYFEALEQVSSGNRYRYEEILPTLWDVTSYVFDHNYNIFISMGMMDLLYEGSINSLTPQETVDDLLEEMANDYMEMYSTYASFLELDSPVCAILLMKGLSFVIDQQSYVYDYITGDYQDFTDERDIIAGDAQNLLFEELLGSGNIAAKSSWLNVYLVDDVDVENQCLNWNNEMKEFIEMSLRRGA